MFEAKTYPMRALRLVLYTVAVIVVLESIHALMVAKDVVQFEAWYIATGEQYTLSDYTTLAITNMLFQMAIPVLYALYAFLANRKLGFTPIAKWIWTALLLYAFAMKAITLQWQSVFWYGSVIGLFVLVVINLSMDRFYAIDRFHETERRKR